MPQAAINGTVLEYEVSGSGDTLVLVHGSASDLRTWHPQQEALAERFRVVRFSRRFHWPNEPEKLPA